ncbi:MAG: hypothetical protein JWP06_271 [Candidatus Saccharibacteria bacterium]|nr:hypothetical protein [Candidatus Saccharibacteria bacterium]
MLFHQLLEPLHSVARAGGGGSSSGGDGGGVLIYLLGYLPMHFIGALLRKRQENLTSWMAAQVIGWMLCAIYCVFWVASTGIFIGGMIAACAVLGTGAGLYNWFSKLKRNKRETEELKQAASFDPVWNEQVILRRASDVFMMYQQDWTARSWERFSQYMTLHYQQHSSLMIAALLQARRINKVNEPVIDQVMITELRDSLNNAEDTVTVGITAHARDVLIDELTGEELYVDKSQFTEYWSFKRVGNEWYLDGIEQVTATTWKADASLQQLAQKYGYFYSLDWGWLLIPKRGRLFGRVNFGVSDINNHIIGIYNNNYLLQLYTYDLNPKNSGSYLIAQTNVPKTYGDIVVRRKKWTNLLKPKRLEKISMEWGDFNKKYEVFATTYEGATSFELLHPAFMEKLEALPFEVNIEVVDNVVYLYSPQKTENNSVETYAKMLEILQEAYKQMKM